MERIYLESEKPWDAGSLEVSHFRNGKGRFGAILVVPAIPGTHHRLLFSHTSNLHLYPHHLKLSPGPCAMEVPHEQGSGDALDDAKKRIASAIFTFCEKPAPLVSALVFSHPKRSIVMAHGVHLSEDRPPFLRLVGIIPIVASCLVRPGELTEHRLFTLFGREVCRHLDLEDTIKGLRAEFDSVDSLHPTHLRRYVELGHELKMCHLMGCSNADIDGELLIRRTAEALEAEDGSLERKGPISSMIVLYHAAYIFLERFVRTQSQKKIAPRISNPTKSSTKPAKRKVVPREIHDSVDSSEDTTGDNTSLLDEPPTKTTRSLRPRRKSARLISAPADEEGPFAEEVEHGEEAIDDKAIESMTQNARERIRSFAYQGTSM